MRTRLFKAPAPAFKNWADAFAGAPRLQCTVLVTGRARQDNGAWQPISAYLLERRPEFLHENDPYFFVEQFHLIDTGLARGFRSYRDGVIRSILKGTKPRSYEQAPGESLGEHLCRLGVGAIGAVFFTHLHFEQTSGLSDISNYVSCLVGHAETPPTMLSLFESELRAAADIREFSFENADRMPPLGPCIDVFGDGSLWAISTPGHTIGHVSYLVVTTKGPALIAGDLAATIRGDALGVDYGRYRELGRFSVESLRRFLDAYPEVRLAPGGNRPTSPDTPASVSPNSSEVWESARGPFE